MFIRDHRLQASAEARYASFSSPSKQAFPFYFDLAGPGTPRLRFAMNGAQLELHPRAAHLAGDMNEYTLDSFLRVALSLLLLPKSGLLLHASTVVRDGRSYVFMGRSGAGKSTIARHAPSGTALTDEISLVRMHESVWHAHGTPFWGEFRSAGQNVRYPLAGMFLLVQAASNRTTRLRGKEALRALLENVLFFSGAREDREQLLRIAAELVGALPVYRLEFTRNMDFWEEIAS